MCGKIQPSTRQFTIPCHDEAFFGPIVAEVPVSMKPGGEIVKEKGDTMRLARDRRRLDLPRELGGEFDEAQLLIAEQFQRRIVRPQALSPRLAQRRANPGR